MLKLLEVTKSQEDFLKDFVVDGIASSDDIPIYIQEGSYFRHVPGVACSQKQRKDFLNAPDGLWLAGVATFVLVDQGICVVPDERGGGKWKATSQGWMNHVEGGDEKKAAMRELHEEIVVFKNTDRVEVLPQGMRPRWTAKTLAIMLDGNETVGSLKLLRVNENIHERVIEFVYVWDLRGQTDLAMAYDDEFFRGGHMGANVHVLDEQQKLAGVFSGQQGYVPVAQSLALHPVIAQSWDDLTQC